MTPSSVKNQFDLTGRVAIITGGAGLLGVKHAEAIAEMGGIPVLIDIDKNRVELEAKSIAENFEVDAVGLQVDITEPDAVSTMLETVLGKYGHVDILINNAANNPKVDASGSKNLTRLENFPLDTWNADISVGLTGAFLCSRVCGADMAKVGKGVILNIASDLGVIAPDQRIYRQEGLTKNEQPVKPVTYSVVKHGLIGLTRYLSTYWCDNGIRVNALSPGGIKTNQDDVFLNKLTNLIPLGRMAHEDEYKAAVVFLVSDASSYMTGANISIDGGRTAW